MTAADNPRALCKWCGCVFEEDGQFSPWSTRRGCAYWSRGWLDGIVSVRERYPERESVTGPRLHVAAARGSRGCRDERLAGVPDQGARRAGGQPVTASEESGTTVLCANCRVPITLMVDGAATSGRTSTTPCTAATTCPPWSPHRQLLRAMPAVEITLVRQVYAAVGGAVSWTTRPDRLASRTAFDTRGWR